MKPRSKKAIVFDFDGTLTDSMEIENLSMSKALTSVGCFSVSKDEITSHYGPTERGIISSIVPPGKKEEAWKNCLLYYRELAKDLRPFDGILDILSSLKEKKILTLLVTGRSRETLDISLHDMQLESYFQKTYTGSDSGTNKEESLTSLFKDFSLDKNEVLYIGDTLDDIRMMRNIQTEILSAGYSHDKEYQKLLEEKNPGNVCSSVQQLKTRLMEVIVNH